MKSRPKDLVFKGELRHKYAFLTQGIQVMSELILICHEVLDAKVVNGPSESRPKYRSVAP